MKKGKAKKKSNKTKINFKCKPCKMSLRQKEFMAVTILAIFVFALLLAVTNTTSQNATITGQDIAGLENIDTGQIGTLLKNIMDPAKADEAVFKWILFFTFAIGLWGIASLFFKRGKGGLIKLLSLPIAFAMVYLLNLNEILAGFLGYTALGMTAIVILPFVAIVFASIKILEKQINAAKIVTQLVMWFAYVCFMVYFFFRMILWTPGVEFNLAILIITGVGILAGIGIIIWNKPWRRWISILGREGVKKGIEDVQEALGAKEKAEAKRGKKIIVASEEEIKKYS